MFSPQPRSPRIRPGGTLTPWARALGATFTLTFGLTLGVTMIASPPVRAADPPGGSPPSLSFRVSTDGGFEFDTGPLRGRLRAAGKSLGLSAVTHVSTGASLERGHGLFSHYRVFANGRRFGGGAWDWPGSVAGLEQGAVRVTWAATGERPFTLEAVYRWADPLTLYLETRVTAQTNLAGFEVFLASYFHEGFTNAMAWTAPEPPATEPAFTRADRSAGDWQMFPRDRNAVTVIQDGRWTLEPNPVAWTIRPRFQQPLALRRAVGSGLTVALMASPRDGFALAMPFEAEGHFSTYLSLFGREIRPGETASAHARLAVLTSLGDADAVKAWLGFVADSKRNRP